MRKITTLIATLVTLLAIVLPASAQNRKRDRIAPSVSLTAPTTGTAYTTAQSVLLSAIADDNIGVTKVEFYEDGLLKSTDVSVPYTYAWSISTADNGTHVWTARAYDAAKNRSISVGVSLIVNIPSATDTTAPIVSLTAPASGTNYITAQTVSITATATDDVAVASVKFYDNGVLKGTDTGAPYAFAWAITDTDNGTHAWYVVATDTSGNTTQTASVSLLVSIPVADVTPPTVAIASPATGTTYTSNATITLTATASDDVSVSVVNFYEDGVFKGTDTVAPYTYAWAFTFLDNGAHTWYAIASDPTGNTTQSTTITLTVAVVLPDAVPPVVAITDPPSGTTYSSTANWTTCAVENAVCSFTGSREVRYGASGVYTYLTLTDGTLCSNSVFGDPIFGTAKTCALSSSAVTITAVATDDVAMAWVNFLDNGVFVARDTTTPFTYSWSFTSSANGTHNWTAQAVDSSGNTTTSAVVALTVAIAVPPPPTPTSGRGPQSTITCPGGSVNVAAGANIQTFVNNYAAGSTFCLAAGVYPISNGITPKTGDTFVGVYGAILDGTGWVSTDTTQGAIHAHNQDIDNVTIRNLVIRNMPQKGIHAFRDYSSGWTVEYCEIYNNKDGVSLADGAVIQHNYIHNNRGNVSDPATANQGGNYILNYKYLQGAPALVWDNEISYGGPEQKSIDVTAVTWRDNWVHHNVYAGIWLDGDGGQGSGSLFEGNLVEDNGGPGIMWEQGQFAVIRNNTISRNGDQAIFVSTSNNGDIYGNTLLDNYRSIALYVTCTSINSQPWNPDLHHITAHDNTIRVPSTSGVLANYASQANCTTAQFDAYTNGSKSLTFTHNAYQVPSTSGAYWLWGVTKTFAQWQLIPQDATGSQATSSGSSTASIDAARKIDWTAAGTTGGVLTRTSICSTLSAGATAADINSALAACPAGQVVKLNAGTYNIGALTISRSNVTLRGAGPNQTFLVFTSPDGCTGLWTNFCVTNAAGGTPNSDNPGTVANWTAGYAKGATNVTLSTVSGLSVGDMLVLDQLDDVDVDTNTIWVCQKIDVCTPHTEGGAAGRAQRAQMQFVKVTAINGFVVTISPGLYMPNWRVGQSPQAWWITPGTGVGIEDLSMEHSGSGVDAASGMFIGNMRDSWVKNVRSLNANRNHIWLYDSAHITVRDSYFYGTLNASSQSYGVETRMGSDHRIENNIFEHITTPMMAGNTTGTVWGYNYALDDYYTTPLSWQQASSYFHDAGVDNVLWEGNDGPGFNGDNLHGTAHFGTAFRNYWNGRDIGKTAQTSPVILQAGQRYMNLLGNVLGTAGYHTNYECAAVTTTANCTSNADVSIFSLGWSGNQGSHLTTDGTLPNDLLVKSTMFRWGNYDVATGASRFSSAEVPTGISPYPQTLPTTNSLPASLYLSGVPSWFGVTAYPPIGPDVVAGALVSGHVYKIPARRCYEATSATNGILNFNANACY